MIIAIDFDGTCVTHDYPDIGHDIGAEPVLRKIVKSNHHLILNTMRSGKELQDAIKWFEEREISLWAVNDNPSQHTWTSSPKVCAHLYIDDAAMGAPLIYQGHGRPYINWVEVERLLTINGQLPADKKALTLSHSF